MRRPLTKKQLYAVSGVVAIVAMGLIAAFALRPRPSLLAVTPRRGDDTLVINQTHPTRLRVAVLDQYRRQLRADTAVRYRWIAGDSIGIAADGKLQCDSHRDAVVRATFGNLAHEFVVRCRPVTWIEGASWMDLVVGDSSRQLSFVAHGPDGRAVTELRGAVTASDGSVVALEGTTVRPKRAGAAFVSVEIGDAKLGVPVLVYQPVKSFAGNPRSLGLIAMRVSLARGDTIETPVPKAAFWVTYISRNTAAAPPTIELVGDGLCTTGDGIRARRIEDGKYAKYCNTGDGARMMIAHGAGGADRVDGTVALRMMW